MEDFVLAGGCFWCLDAIYRGIAGVESVVSGYTGGGVPEPSYEVVCTGTTGHAEAVQVTFDTASIPSDIILDIFFSSHDPTTLNRQGNDKGTQYRSAMFYSHHSQKVLFSQARDRAQALWPAPVVTTLEELKIFYPAEEYHQDYFTKHPHQGYCAAVIQPKVAKARKSYASWLR